MLSDLGQTTLRHPQFSVLGDQQVAEAQYFLLAARQLLAKLGILPAIILIPAWPR